MAVKTKYNGLIICVLALIGFHFVQVWFYQKMVMTNSIQQQKERTFSLEKQPINTWITGDSHPLLDLDPNVFSNGFNWAGTSENYVLNYFKIKYLISKYPKPAQILLSAEYHSFSAQGMSLLLQHELDDGFWANKLDATMLSEQLQNTQPIRWKIAANWFPYAGQYYRGLKSFGQKPDSIGYRGWMPSKEVFDENPLKNSLLKAKIESHAGKFAMVDSLQVQYLKAIIGLCRQEGIVLQLVKFPVHPLYRKELARKTNLNDLDQLFSHLADSIPMLDYRNLFDNKTHLFSDPDHLNEEGARLFSKILSTESKVVKEGNF